jgi:hypothetical protein
MRVVKRRAMGKSDWENHILEDAEHKLSDASSAHDFKTVITAILTVLGLIIAYLKLKG